MRFEKISKKQYEKDIKELMDKKDIEAHLTHEAIQLPKRATKGSAGYDFFLPVSLTIQPHERTPLIPSGIRCKLDENSVMLIFVRSSIGIKKGLNLSNGTGVIDSDYYNASNEGHIQLSFVNTSEEPITLKLGEKIAQGVITNYVIADDDDVDKERVGGFGSTN